ncbi:CCAAT/enhancer-binding protein gamma [Trichinella papuae]|uniref:CCAAT/enhancer-binding protein gamma n=1 Tax=Trichinella papuae TaxID=268474 RepID=A0A0V1N315_9BILA|nr:CCAAT/enhancer-binding protein gamma [Trichinella papuae]
MLFSWHRSFAFPSSRVSSLYTGSIVVERVLGITRQIHDKTQASTSASPTETTSGASNDSYRIRRARNNNSVRKSREKTRQVFQEKLDRVQFLKEENAKLEMHMLHLKAQLKTLEEKAFPRKNVSPQNHCKE